MSETTPTTKQRVMSLVVGAAIVAVGVFLLSIPLRNDRTIFRINGGDTFIIDVADEPEERFQGLSGRQGLDSREGMLFIFENPNFYGFSMRGMLFPLDFVWLDENKTIVQIDENVPHTNDPPTQVMPSAPIKYVFEVNAGTAAELGWEVGQTAEFNRD